MRSRFTALMMVLALTFSASVLPVRQAEAQVSNPAANRLVVPVDGTVGGVADTLTGTFAISRFAIQNGELVAVGRLTATLSDGLGNVTSTVVRQVVLPVAEANGTCDVLHLELGPLDLDLLGLQVHLDQIVLDITAQSGPGNLLGNLLCAIAGLLDGGALTTQLANLLNQLLGALAAL